VCLFAPPPAKYNRSRPHEAITKFHVSQMVSIGWPDDGICSQRAHHSWQLRSVLADENLSFGVAPAAASGRSDVCPAHHGGRETNPTILVFSLTRSIVYSNSGRHFPRVFHDPTVRPSHLSFEICVTSTPDRNASGPPCRWMHGPATAALTVLSILVDRGWGNGERKWGGPAPQHWDGRGARGRVAVGVHKCGATSCADSFR
jgi:hypothetical protein